LTDGDVDGNVGRMNPNEASSEPPSGEPTDHECQCPEPCNCDHENE